MDENNNSFLPDDNGDDYIIGEGFSVQEYETLPQRTVKKHSNGKSIVKSIIWIVSIIIVSVGIAFGVIYAGADYLGIGFGRGENCVVEIPSGATTKVISEKLKEANAVRLPILFRVYSRLKHFDSQYKYGVYTFNNEAGYEVLAEMLITDGAKAESVRVKIPEAATIDDIAKLLDENGVCTKSDFLDVIDNGDFNYDFVKEIPSDSVYYRLEGYLYPDTYDFYNYSSKECAYLAVDKMLKTLDEKLGKSLKEKLSSSKYSMHEIMTLSSIVELEAGGNDEEMPKVAAIFYNRLDDKKDFPTLGSSPTRKYPHGNGRYDTYQCKGLPPGPVCSPSIGAVKSTISPTENFDYYYFVTDATMKFYYTKTLSQHNSLIARLKAEKNWIYEEW